MLKEFVRVSSELQIEEDKPTWITTGHNVGVEIKEDLVMKRNLERWEAGIKPTNKQSVKGSKARASKLMDQE